MRNLKLYSEQMISDYTSFGLKNATKYPNIWKDIKLYLLAFPTSYLVERGNYIMYHGPMYFIFSLLLSKMKEAILVYYLLHDV